MKGLSATWVSIFQEDGTNPNIWNQGQSYNKQAKQLCTQTT